VNFIPIKKQRILFSLINLSNSFEKKIINGTRSLFKSGFPQKNSNTYFKVEKVYEKKKDLSETG